MLALVTGGLGGEQAEQRLGVLVRGLQGSAEQVAALLRDRSGAPAVDVAALLRGGGAGA